MAMPAIWCSGWKSCWPTGGSGTACSALRKDNTGYDLRDLFIGSEGTLGIITAAVMKLFPAPKSKATAFVGLAGLGEALRAASTSPRMGAGELTAFELMPRIGIEFVLRHAEGTRDPLAGPHPWYVLMELSSQRAGRGEPTRGASSAQALEQGVVADAAIAASLAGRRFLAAARDAVGGAASRGRQHQARCFGAGLARAGLPRAGIDASPRWFPAAGPCPSAISATATSTST